MTATQCKKYVLLNSETLRETLYDSHTVWMIHILTATQTDCYTVWELHSVTEACNTDTTPNQPHRNFKTFRTKNNTINVVIQQNCRMLLMMDILISETCWAHKKWHKIASDMKLVFYSSTIPMMHGPIYIRYVFRTLFYYLAKDKIVIADIFGKAIFSNIIA